MKRNYKIATLGSVLLLALTGCQTELKAYCLETSDTFEYYEGRCYQACANDIVETVFVHNLPINPEADPEQYKYDLTWNTTINTDHFTFAGGLVGKRVIEVFRWSDTVLKINFDGHVVDQEAQFGYIKISPSAFKAHTSRVRGAYLYAYCAIGPTVDLVKKPSQE